MIRSPKVRLVLTLVAVLVLGSAACAEAQSPRTIRFAAGPLAAIVVFRDTEVSRIESELRAFLPGAFSRYHKLFGGPPRGAGGLPLDSVVITLASAPVGEGDADPGVLRIAVGEHPTFGFYDWRLTLLHEAFHLWSGESFRYVGGAEQWFNEGVSEFYAVQTAARLGLIDPLQAVGITATALGFYESAPGVGTVPLTEAARTQELKFRNYFLVYAGGWIAALVLDRDIRARTHNERSLADLLRRLYRTFDAQQRLYSTAQIPDELRVATGLDYTPFFKAHIQGPSALPIADHLSLGNLAFALTARAANARGPAMDTFLVLSLGLDRIVAH